MLLDSVKFEYLLSGCCDYYVTINGGLELVYR